MQPGKIWLIFELKYWDTLENQFCQGHNGFEILKPAFRISSLYMKTGVSLITAGYHMIPQDPLILAFSMEFTILLHGIGIL